MIERDGSNNLTPDSKASLAIRAMGPSALADKLELIEALYHQWLGVKVDTDGHIVENSWFTGIKRAILWLARNPVKIFRSQINVLVEAFEKTRTDAQAAAIQAGYYQTYLKMAEEQRGLYKFLEEHFPHDLKEGQVRDIPLSQLVQEIMFRQVPRAAK